MKTVSNTIEAMLVGIELRKSIKYGGTYYRLSFADLDNLLPWECDVQIVFDNYEINGWKDIAENKRYGFYTELQTKSTKTKTGRGIINADSFPKLKYAVASRDLAIEVVQLEIARKERINSNNTFDKIFAPRD